MTGFEPRQKNPFFGVPDTNRAVQVLWNCRIHNGYESIYLVALNPGLGCVRDVVSAIISHEPSVLFSSFGCCISKGSPYQIKEHCWRIEISDLESRGRGIVRCM